jgi:hypothetical protein
VEGHRRSTADKAVTPSLPVGTNQVQLLAGPSLIPVSAVALSTSLPPEGDRGQLPWLAEITTHNGTSEGSIT